MTTHDPKALQSALIRAERKAEEYTKKTGNPCRARKQIASNGEACIMYDITQKSGALVSLFAVPDDEVAGRDLTQDPRRINRIKKEAGTGATDSNKPE